MPGLLSRYVAWSVMIEYFSCHPYRLSVDSGLVDAFRTESCGIVPRLCARITEQLDHFSIERRNVVGTAAGD
jgi:hypothetical protein